MRLARPALRFWRSDDQKISKFREFEQKIIAWAKEFNCIDRFRFDTKKMRYLLPFDEEETALPNGIIEETERDILPKISPAHV
ncbi:MAG: hypothetical protein JXQ27_04225 [Acidobacteria bacterium]|nr:hypothetical protein [Acidobacteriota bacterium]